MIPKKTLLIVDDHPLFREGLKTIIARDSRYEIVGEAGNGREAVRMSGEKKPDLVLLDIALPDRPGIDLTGEIKRISPRTIVMIVSMHSKVDYIVKAFQAGATGYVVKDSAAERLLQGIEAVLKGEYFLDSSVSHKVVSKLMELPRQEARMTDMRYDALTSREQEVMVLLAEGLSAKEVAEKLFVSPRTVENHRSSIMRKLDLHSNHELIRYAAKLGLIDLESWTE
ncbi:MAG: response regulator transcription factor [Desulfatiglandales bacterium]